MTAISTFSGRLLDPRAPRVADIAIEDIAHHLALLNRFVGATRRPYSVAQHSVLVSFCCEPPDALHGLLHDGSEAYLGDVSRPLKSLPAMAGYRAIEAQLQIVIYAAFGLAPTTPASVKHIDDELVATEARELFPSASVPAWALARTPLDLWIDPWSAAFAEVAFLDRFRRLTQG